MLPAGPSFGIEPGFRRYTGLCCLSGLGSLSISKTPRLSDLQLPPILSKEISILCSAICSLVNSSKVGHNILIDFLISSRLSLVIWMVLPSSIATIGVGCCSVIFCVNVEAWIPRLLRRTKIIPSVIFDFKSLNSRGINFLTISTTVFPTFRAIPRPRTSGNPTNAQGYALAIESRTLEGTGSLFLSISSVRVCNILTSSMVFL